MQSSGPNMIQVPRAVIFGLMAALIPGIAAAFNILGDPRLHGVRGVDIVRIAAIGWCAGIFFSGLMLLINSKVQRD